MPSISLARDLSSSVVRLQEGPIEEMSVLILAAAVEALEHAERHGDVGPLQRLLMALPREQRWIYSELLRKHSPVVATSEKGTVIIKLRKANQTSYCPFNLKAFVAAAEQQTGVSVLPYSDGMLTALKLLTAPKSRVAVPRNEVELKKVVLPLLVHAEAHGDVMPLQRFIGGLPESYWYHGLRRWLREHSPVYRDCNGNLKIHKRRSPDYRSYNLEGASRNTILEAWPAPVVTQWRSTGAMRNLAGLTHSELLAIYQEVTTRLAAKQGKGKAEYDLEVAAIEAEWRSRHDRDDYFVWPVIHKPTGTNLGFEINAPELGVFAALGYRVGRIKGVNRRLRLLLLDYIFSNQLPPLNSRTYMNKWGQAGRALRLKVMAYFLVHAIENASARKDCDLRLAISDWTDDLNYLYEQYYVRQFRFAWPTKSSG